MTLKENFIPWSIYLKRGWAVEPLSVGLYFNTVFGPEFWRSQPARYPDSYYPFLSTRCVSTCLPGSGSNWCCPATGASL